MSGFTLTVRFTGVNAYVYPTAPNDPLTVVMPNATKLGRSPQKDLPRHFPVLLGLDEVATRKQYSESWKGQIDLKKVRYLFWQRLAIRAYRKSGKHGRVEDTSFYAENKNDKFGSLLPIPKDSVSDPPPFNKVAGQVLLYAGRADEEGPCTYEWHTKASLVDTRALVSTLKVEIGDLHEVELELSRFSSNKTSTLVLKKDTRLRIGNLCAENIFKWPTNDRVSYDKKGDAKGSFVDHDFGWMYVLADPGKATKKGPAPLPKVVGKESCLISKDDKISDLPKLLEQQFDGDLGGGGCGCECGGCRAATPD